MSAEWCGCDEEARHVCERHQKALENYTGTLPPTQNEEWQPSERGPQRPLNIPTDPESRKQFPIASGLLRYFPDALVEIAHVSWVGNNQHNPGQPLHWARHKSMDQEDTAIRHFMEAGTRDSDGVRHTAKFAWRALAMLQLEIEKEREDELRAHPNGDRPKGA